MQMPALLPEEVEAAIIIGAGDPTGFRDGLPELLGSRLGTEKIVRLAGEPHQK